MIAMKDSLVLVIVTLDGQNKIEDCDTVLLPVSEDSKGRFSGSYGIRKGHAKSVFSVAQGQLIAYRDEKIIFSAKISDGFAMVESDTVSVTVDKIEEM